MFLHFLLTYHPYLPVLFSKKYFYFHLFPLVFVLCQIYIFFNVALVVVVVVAEVEAVVGGVELQRGSLLNAERSNS